MKTERVKTMTACAKRAKCRRSIVAHIGYTAFCELNALVKKELAKGMNASLYTLDSLLADYGLEPDYLDAWLAY